MATRRDNVEPKSRFGLGKKEWLFISGSLTLRLWFFAPKGAGEITGTVFGQNLPSTALVSSGLTLVEVTGINSKQTPRLEATCTTQQGDVLSFSQDIPAEQPSNSEQVKVKWRDFRDGDELCLEVAVRVLSLAGRVLPPMPVTIMLGSNTREPIATDEEGIARTVFRDLELNRVYTLSVTTPTSGKRSEPVTIKPNRIVAYDIREVVVPVENGQPTDFKLRINVWDDVKITPISGLKVNGYANNVARSAMTDDQGIAELIFPFETEKDSTSYRVLVEDGKEKKSSIGRPAEQQQSTVGQNAPRSFREAFRNNRNR